MKTDYDVIVVGGGPAGAATATHLARNGVAVLIIDRAEFPRDKACGEFFSPPVRGLLSSLQVYEDVMRAGISTVPAANLIVGGAACRGRFDTAPHPWASAGGFSLERRILDNLLWQNAARQGAQTRSGVALRGLIRSDSGAVCGVHTDSGDFTARIVVGADGAKSRVAREMGVILPLPRLQKIALVSHYDAPATVSEKRVEMNVSHLPEGRGAVACGVGVGPVGTINITLVAPESEARRLAEVGAEVYADTLLAECFPAVAERLQKATRTRIKTCGTFGHKTTTPIADGALLVGDAATFIDPFTGEGVYFALRGAELAAAAIAAALRRGDVSAQGLTPYARARRRELAPKYAVCDWIERAVHSEKFMAWAAPQLARRPVIMDAILRVTGDMVNLGTLLSWKPYGSSLPRMNA